MALLRAYIRPWHELCVSQKSEQELNESRNYGEGQLEAGQVKDSLLVLLRHGRLFMAASLVLLWTTNKGHKILGHPVVTPGR